MCFRVSPSLIGPFGLTGAFRRDVLASQSDLRGESASWIGTIVQFISALLMIALLARVKTVQGEVDKLQSGNATLKMYVENLTKQASKR